MPSPQLFENIFGKNEADPGTVGMLQKLLKEHPYFSLGHFYLLKQTGAKDAAYPRVAAKASLHFENIHLMQRQLYATVAAEDVVSIAAATAAGPDLTHKTPVQEQQVATQPPLQEIEMMPSAISEQTPAAHSEPVVETFAEPAEQPHGQPSADAVEETAAEPAPKIPAPANAPASAAESLLFTPLYATDYFASQGIKLREEVVPNDKLGKQLKSFTDWLKTMKKVHDNRLPEPAVAADSSVQQLAEKSNKEEAVLTESMAEVFLQQGKWHKAKDVYEKLSLLNPSKIAYFAAKIDQIQQK